MAPQVGTEWTRTMKKRIKTEPAPIGEKLLTLREAAAVLRMNPRTLRAYLRRREIEGRVIGGKWRFRRIDLDRFYEDAPRSWDFEGKDKHEE
jgi:excisionase family DNA binding protein